MRIGLRLVVCLLIIHFSVAGKSLSWQPLMPDTTNLRALSTSVLFANACVQRVYHHWIPVSSLMDKASRYKANNKCCELSLKDESYWSKRVKVDDLGELAIRQLNSSTLLKKDSLLGVVTELLGRVRQLSTDYVLLQNVLDDHSYERDGLDEVDRLLIRFRDGFNYVDEQKEIVYQLARDGFDSLMKEEASSWRNSWVAMQSIIDQNYVVLELSKDFYAGTQMSTPDASIIHQQIQFAAMHKVKNLQGLKEYGSHDGMDPHSKYDYVMRVSGEFASEVANPKSRFRYVIGDYNNIVQTFNRFCELADVPLLPALRQMPFYQIDYPQEAFDEALEIDLSGFATNHMTLLLDVSRSMEEEQRLPALKKELMKFPAYMREEDRVSMVSFTGEISVPLNNVPFKDKSQLKQAVDQLEPVGQTNIAQGLKKALQIAKNNYVPNGNNRVVLATDGEFELTNYIKSIVKEYKKSGVILSVFYFGDGQDDGLSLYKMARTTGGQFYFTKKQDIAQALIGELRVQ